MVPVKQAVILAGGEGTRLRPLTLTTPKPLIQIHNKPFAEYLLQLLKKNGIEKIVFLTGYLAEQFSLTLGDGSRFGLTITYSQSPVADDTGTRLRKAAQLFDEQFLLLYGDNYWPLNLEHLLAHHVSSGTLATITVYERNELGKKNNIRVENGLVTAYDKQREIAGLTGVDIGFFILKKKVLDELPEGNVNFEATVLPKLIEQKQLAGYVTRQPYWGLTDQARLPSVAKALNPERRVLFLDRDGTLNVKAPKAEYVKSPQEFEFLPGAIEALKKLSDAGYEFYIISNQSGIARGAMTEADLRAVHQKMQDELQKAGVVIADIYYCSHGWDSACECRKPKPGMFFDAAREHDIDLSRAVFVGDDERDKEAGEAARVKTIVVPSDQGVAAALPVLLS